MKFRAEICPSDLEGLEQDCLALLRKHSLLQDWLQLSEILWRENPESLSLLGSHIFRALWPNYEARRLRRSFSCFGGVDNVSHLNSFLNSPGNSKPPFEISSPLKELSEFFYGASCLSQDIPQGIRWICFSFGLQGEKALSRLWGDWSKGVPLYTTAVAAAAIKLFREGRVNYRNLIEESWEERGIKNYGAPEDSIKTWEGELKEACGEGGVFLKDSEDWVCPIKGRFELPWWQSLCDLAKAEGYRIPVGESRRLIDYWDNGGGGGNFFENLPNLFTKFK